MNMAIQIASKAIYRHAPRIIVSRQEACDLRFYIATYKELLSQPARRVMNLVSAVTDAPHNVAKIFLMSIKIRRPMNKLKQR
jgi:hypothetical protein